MKIEEINRTHTLKPRYSEQQGRQTRGGAAGALAPPIILDFTK